MRDDKRGRSGSAESGEVSVHSLFADDDATANDDEHNCCSDYDDDDCCADHDDEHEHATSNNHEHEHDCLYIDRHHCSPD